MDNIEELIEKCEREMYVFERVSAQNGKKLLEIVKESNRLEKPVRQKIADEDILKILNKGDAIKRAGELYGDRLEEFNAYVKGYDEARNKMFNWNNSNFSA